MLTWFHLPWFLRVDRLINPRVLPHTNSAETRTVFSCVLSLYLQQTCCLGMCTASMIRHAQTSCLFSLLLINALYDYLQNSIRDGSCAGHFCRLVFILAFCSFATYNTPPEFAHTFYITPGLSFLPLSGTLLKEQSSYNLVQNMGHKGPVLRPGCIGHGSARTQTLFYSFLPLTNDVASNIKHIQ
jgi:hypothetical protein